MEYGFTTAAYVVAAVLFILSLGGLSGQESAKRAIWYGIAGMALAVLATLFGPGAGNWRPWCWKWPSADTAPRGCRVTQPKPRCKPPCSGKTTPGLGRPTARW